MALPFWSRGECESGSHLTADPLFEAGVSNVRKTLPLLRTARERKKKRVWACTGSKSPKRGECDRPFDLRYYVGRFTSPPPSPPPAALLMLSEELYSENVLKRSIFSTLPASEGILVDMVYARHFSQYDQHNWQQTLPTAEFAYNNKNHMALLVWSFEARGGYSRTYGRIPAVRAQPTQIENLRTELVTCLHEAQDHMMQKFNKGVKNKPKCAVGDQSWLNSKKISTMRPSKKTDHQLLRPSYICQQVSESTYTPTPDLGMKGAHPVFHMSVLPKHQTDSITGRQKTSQSCCGQHQGGIGGGKHPLFQKT